MLQDKNLNIIIFDLNGGKILEKKLDSHENTLIIFTSCPRKWNNNP